MVIVLRSANSAERADLVVRLVPDYAQAMVGAGEWPADQALQKARHDVDTRMASQDAIQEVLCICTAADGARLGDLWLQYREEGGLTVCVVLYVFIAVHLRGRGYAQAALLAAEERAWQHGALAMRLSVNGNNGAARGLYHKLGYRVLNARMEKLLQRTPLARQGEPP